MWVQELVEALSELLPSQEHPAWAAEALGTLGRRTFSHVRGAEPLQEMPSSSQARITNMRVFQMAPALPHSSCMRKTSAVGRVPRYTRLSGLMSASEGRA